MLSIIGMIIAGAIIGALARLIMRGEQNISVLWTIVLGAVGALIGSTVAGFFGVAQTAGIDWIRWVKTASYTSRPRKPPGTEQLLARAPPHSVTIHLTDQRKRLS